MLPSPKLKNVYVAYHKVDFRKQHDGLLGECYRLGLNPIAGDVVLFVGRCRRKMKLLFADDTGIWVAFKRFNKECMKTSFRFLDDPSVKEISQAELSMFFEGCRYKIERRVSRQISGVEIAASQV